MRRTRLPGILCAWAIAVACAGSGGSTTQQPSPQDRVVLSTSGRVDTVRIVDTVTVVRFDTIVRLDTMTLKDSAAILMHRLQDLQRRLSTLKSESRSERTMNAAREDSLVADNRSLMKELDQVRLQLIQARHPRTREESLATKHAAALQQYASYALSSIQYAPPDTMLEGEEHGVTAVIIAGDSAPYELLYLDSVDSRGRIEWRRAALGPVLRMTVEGKSFVTRMVNEGDVRLRPHFKEEVLWQVTPVISGRKPLDLDTKVRYVDGGQVSLLPAYHTSRFIQIRPNLLYIVVSNLHDYWAVYVPAVFVPLLLWLIGLLLPRKRERRRAQHPPAHGGR